MGYQDSRQNWSQRNQRRPMTYTDKHGRRYGAQIEIRSGHPTGLIQAEYTAPLMPPQMYLEVNTDAERPNYLHINYDRWIADIRRERLEWDRQARSLALKRNPHFNLSRDEYPADVLDAMGATPQAVDPVIAAKQGNRWILGLTTVPDKRLVKFFTPEQLDPAYLEKNEPNYRDDAEAIADELDDTSEEVLDREISRAAQAAASRAREDHLDLEEAEDPAATGGRRIPVKAEASSETERKRAARMRERRQQEEARLEELNREREAVQRQLDAARLELEAQRMEADERRVREELEGGSHLEPVTAGASAGPSAADLVDVEL